MPRESAQLADSEHETYLIGARVVCRSALAQRWLGSRQCVSNGHRVGTGALSPTPCTGVERLARKATANRGGVCARCVFALIWRCQLSIGVTVVSPDVQLLSVYIARKPSTRARPAADAAPRVCVSVCLLSGAGRTAVPSARAGYGITIPISITLYCKKSYFFSVY